jgi:hypothetical protein
MVKVTEAEIDFMLQRLENNIYATVADLLVKMSAEPAIADVKAPKALTQIADTIRGLSKPLSHECDSCEGYGRINCRPDEDGHSHPCDTCRPLALEEFKRGEAFAHSDWRIAAEETPADGQKIVMAWPNGDVCRGEYHEELLKYAAPSSRGSHWVSKIGVSHWMPQDEFADILARVKP